MIERVEEYFKSVIIELNEISIQLENDSKSISSLKDCSIRLCDIFNNPCSPLVLSFNYLVYKDSSKIEIDAKEKLYRIKLIIQEYGKNLNLITEYRKIITPYGRLLEAVKSKVFDVDLDNIWTTDEYLDLKSDISKSNKINYLKSVSYDLLAQSLSFIQNNILDILIYQTFIPKKEINKEFSKNQLDYYNKWLENTVNFSDLSKNTYYDLNDFIYKENLSITIREQIDNKREELFEEGINRKLDSLINDLSEIDKEKRIQTINIHKKLINSFLDGNTSQLLIDRLNVFIKIKQPEKVILKYDELLHSDYYYHSELNVYEQFKNREFSPVFNAHLIYEYLKVLNNPKSIPDQEEEDSEQISTKSKRLSFKFNGDLEKLILTFKSLQFKIDLLKDDTQIEYFIDVMTSDDLSEFSDNIIIGCDTKQFAYVLTSLKPYFNNLTMVSIEDCNLFKSKKGNYIKANGLYSKNQMKPKKSEDIDKAINKMK